MQMLIEQKYWQFHLKSWHQLNGCFKQRQVVKKPFHVMGFDKNIDL